MILSDVKRYVKEHRRVPIQDLVNRFDTEPEAIRGMLNHMIHKGRVRRLESESGECSGCSKCDAFQLEIYEWVD